METLANLECFARTAETGSFSAAARQLGLTPSAVSRNVGMLERHLGVRLFHRTTRKLTVTEAGEHFLASITDNLQGLRSAIADITTFRDEPAGVLKVSMAPSFCVDYLLSTLPDFMNRYPGIHIDWHLDNRHVDLVSEGFDAAIGRGANLSPGVVSRTLAQVHVIAVASPAYIADRRLPTHPAELCQFDLIDMRSVRNGRLVQWALQNPAGDEVVAPTGDGRIAFSDPAGLCGAARLGLGVALLAVPHVLKYLERGELVRLLPQWHADGGPIALYYANRTLVPAKTRVFVNYMIETFKQRRLAERFSAVHLR